MNPELAEWVHTDSDYTKNSLDWKEGKSYGFVGVGLGWGQVAQ